MVLWFDGKSEANEIADLPEISRVPYQGHCGSPSASFQIGVAQAHQRGPTLIAPKVCGSTASKSIIAKFYNLGSRIWYSRQTNVYPADPLALLSLQPDLNHV
jgi:hypothetical protein